MLTSLARTKSLACTKSLVPVIPCQRVKYDKLGGWTAICYLTERTLGILEVFSARTAENSSDTQQPGWKMMI